MTKETEFPHPPRGHIAVLGYDPVNERWQVFYVDDDGHVSVDVKASALPSGAATAAKQLADGHNVTVDNPSLAVTGAFYQETQPVSVAELPLPDGATTQTTLEALITELESKLETADLEIDADKRLSVNLRGWDGAASHKLPMLWGYSDRWVQEASGAASGAGNAVAAATAVSPGYVYVLQAAGLRHQAGAAKSSRIWVVNNGVYVRLVVDITLAHNTWLLWQGEITLEEGDVVQAMTTAPGDTKTVVLHVWGYKMKVAE